MVIAASCSYALLSFMVTRRTRESHAIVVAVSRGGSGCLSCGLGCSRSLAPPHEHGGPIVFSDGAAGVRSPLARAPADARGRRTHASDCEDVAVLNQLDGFNLQPRFSVPFDGTSIPRRSRIRPSSWSGCATRSAAAAGRVQRLVAGRPTPDGRLALIPRLIRAFEPKGATAGNGARASAYSGAL